MLAGTCDCITDGGLHYTVLGEQRFLEVDTVVRCPSQST